MTFKRKIIAVIFVSLIINIPVSIVTIRCIKTTSDSFQKVSLIQNKLDLYNQIAQYLSDFERGQKGYMLVGDESYLEPYSIAEVKFNETVNKALVLSDSESTKTKLEAIIKTKDEWIQKSSIPQMMARKKQERGIISTDDFVKILKGFNDKETFQKIHENILTLKRKEEDSYNSISLESKKLSNRSINLSILSVISYLMSLMLIAFFALKASSKVNLLIRDLESMLDSVKSKINSLNDLSTNLNQVTGEQSTAIQTTSSATTQLSATVGANTSSIKESLQLTEEGSKSASYGEKLGAELNLKLEDMRSSLLKDLKEILSSFSEVEKFSVKVSEIQGMTKLINDIVFQTKLLSFNASVEAARAGEFGKGFSVVAEEVSRLSKMSGESAKQIEETLSVASKDISEITSRNKNIIIAIENRMDKILDDIILNGENNGQAFSKIVQYTHNIKSVFEKVSQSSLEQLQGIRDIEKNMNQLSGASDNTSNAAQVSKEIVSDLQCNMKKVENVVFQLTDEFVGRTIVNKNDNQEDSSEDHRENIPVHGHKAIGF